MEIIIIGGGAAGFFAAANIPSRGGVNSITILEQSSTFLGKVKISGGGRCNVTNFCFDIQELVKNYPRGQKALIGPFNHFQPKDTIEWFAKNSVSLKAEPDGRMFPISDDSQTIIDCLTEACRKNRVKIILRKPVTGIERSGNSFQVNCADGSVFSADQVLVASGSSTKIWNIIAEMGHTIIPPVPSLFTFTINDERIKELPGISVPDAVVSARGVKIKTEGPVLITHKGLSGPAILKFSAWAAREFHDLDYKFTLLVNWIGNTSFEETISLLLNEKELNRLKHPYKYPLFNLSTRLWQSLLAAAGINEFQNWSDISKKQINMLAQELTAGEYQISGKNTFKEEFVTAGGVSLKEVDFRTMESRKIPGLYFAGEVLDIDAVTGGFNFQAAWTTAFIAARSMAG
jgi:predicted Rossmann fold flavoprotein